MNTRLRIVVVILVCTTWVVSLRKKFAPQGEQTFVVQQDQQSDIVAAQWVSWTDFENESGDILPQEQEWWAYLIGSDDPEIVYKKYLLASYLYRKHSAIQALPLAISYATQLGRFDEASLLLKEIPDITTLKDTLEIPVMMKLLMNTSNLDFAQLKQLKDFIETLKQQWSIDDAQYNLYYFVITLIKWDMDNALFYLNGLQAGRYNKEYEQLRSLEASTRQYGESLPSYYLRAVRAMFLYQQGRRWPARNIGQQIRQQDPNYLLAEQLIAYSSMALQDRRGASLSLQQLQKVDASYSDVYQFFQAIAHYSLQEYEASILLFQQIPATSVYYNDVLRYMFLAYLAVEEYDKVDVFLNKLVNQPVLQDADVYTIFDSLLYNWQEKTGHALYERFSSLIERLESRCQTEMKDKAYICLYGKWWMLLATWEEEKAYQVLRRIVSRYPRVSLFKLLWELAQENWNETESEERYRRAFLIQQENTYLWTESIGQVGLQ